MDKVIIPLATVNGVLAYLGTRPYQEVFQLVQSIQDGVKPFPAETTTDSATDGGAEAG